MSNVKNTLRHLQPIRKHHLAASSAFPFVVLPDLSLYFDTAFNSPAYFCLQSLDKEIHTPCQHLKVCLPLTQREVSAEIFSPPYEARSSLWTKVTSLRRQTKGKGPPFSSSSPGGALFLPARQCRYLLLIIWLNELERGSRGSLLT